MIAILVLAVGLAGCGGSARSTSTTNPSPAASRVVYGLGDAPGWFASCTGSMPDCCSMHSAHCALRDMDGYFDNPRFLALLSPASAHRVSDVRLFVPYDAVSSWNGSTTSPGCVPSRILESPWDSAANGMTPAGEGIDDLLDGVIEARADGLTPLVAIAGYPFVTAKPTWDAPFPDPTTTAGYWNYRCGVQGILDDLSRLPAWAQPHAWEALNEPETFSVFRGSSAAPASECDVGAEAQPNGPAKAACVEAIASRVIHGFAGHGADAVIAGSFQFPYASYLAPYVSELATQMPGAQFPSTWSVHDYHEVTTGYTGAPATQLAHFDTALARDTGGRARSLWITEAAPVLDSAVRGGDCPAVGVDAADTLGACLDGQPTRQTAAAQAFFALPRAANAVPITHLFWFQFTGAPGWDSGLMDPAGEPRPAYCVFYGSGECTGSSNAA